MHRFVVAFVLAVLASPAPAAAWGFDAHRFIMDRAIGLLPVELRPVFEKNRAMLVERGGSRSITVKLRRAFESYARRGASGRFDLLFFAAALAHYGSDAVSPFHAVLNYDGQLTGQHGIHARFESALFERYRGELVTVPALIAPIRNPRDFIFDRIIEGTQLVPTILKADLDAIGTRDVYDKAYFIAFFKTNRGVLERRLNESIAATAAMITGAWEVAGRPAVPSVPPPPPAQRRRK